MLYLYLNIWIVIRNYDHEIILGMLLLLQAYSRLWILNLNMYFLLIG